MCFLSSFCSSGLLHTLFVASDFCNPKKSEIRGATCGVPTTAMITIIASNLSNFPLRYHFTDSVKFWQVISLKTFATPKYQDAEQVLFPVRGNVSLGYWSRKTSHSSSRRCNDDENISEEEFIEVFWREESCGHGSQETRHSTSSNIGVCGRMLSMTIHSTSSNHRGYFDTSGSSSQETRHSSSHNRRTRFDVEGRGEYRSLNSHYSSPNQVEQGRVIDLFKPTSIFCTITTTIYSFGGILYGL